MTSICLRFWIAAWCVSCVSHAMVPVVLVHGGAGNIPSGRIEGKMKGVKLAAREGHRILSTGGSVLSAVEAAIKIMEDDEAFNAGYGSVLNLEGDVEMDASIMLGSNLSAGAVTVVRDIAHPITLARMVMEKTPHVLLAGRGANKFALEHGVPVLPPGSLVSPYALEALDSFKKKGLAQTEIGPEIKGEVGTVGAVAIDKDGRLAFGTSTGGINGKYVGRSSDTSLIGSGGYADDYVGAVSTTGHGESITKTCLAHNIIKTMEFGLTAQEATAKCIKYMTQRLNNTAGAITLSKTGEIGIYFSSNRMAWAYRKENELHYGIEQGEDQIQLIV